MTSEPRKLKRTEVATIRAAVLEQQGGICPLCTWNLIETGKTPALDHDHSKGHVRGVLCLNCNQMEGRIRNYGVRARRSLTYLQWIQNLVAYLIKHQENQTGYIHPTHKTPEEKKAKKRK
jgi:hypothetical protein